MRSPDDGATATPKEVGAVLINDKIRQYEKIILCDRLMLNYCRTDIQQCFLER